MVAGAVVAAVAAVVLVIGPWGGDHPRASSRDARARARAPGPAGVAAAYGYPLRCLSVAIALHDPRFARADFDHAVPCGRYTGFVTAIFRRAEGQWVPVLKATNYPCPVRSLPIPVQVELGVCDPAVDSLVSRRPVPKNWASRATDRRPHAAGPAPPPSRQWARSLTQ